MNMQTTDHQELRQKLLATAQDMARSGLSTGSAGNVSVRLDNAMLITPSGMSPEQCAADDIVWMDFAGQSRGSVGPSSEWRFHSDLYTQRPQTGAILHAHSPFATALACQRLDIPPFHYMIARFGGDSIRCAHYATFGTQSLSDHVCEAMNGRHACLMANHGMLVTGRDLTEALALAHEFETLCAQYWRTLQLGPPVLLTGTEMNEALKRFRWYGKPLPGKSET